MSEILYIQTEKNVEVHNPEVYLGDIAKLVCSDQKVLNRTACGRSLPYLRGRPDGMWFRRQI